MVKGGKSSDWVGEAILEPRVWSKGESKTHKSWTTRCQPWQFHSWATAHGFGSKRRLCLPGRHQCPQRGTCAASGQTSALASSLETTNGEPVAIWSTSSMKRLSRKALEQIGDKRGFPKAAKGASSWSLHEIPPWDSQDHLEGTRKTRVPTECWMWRLSFKGEN